MDNPPGAAWREGGDIRYRIAPNAIGPIYCHGREVIRRIFVTVRDSHWREIIPSVARVEEPANGRAKFRASYESADVDFDWVGVLEVDADGAGLSFAIEGVVRRDGTICRLGLIVLLPPDVVAGARGEIVTQAQRRPVAIPESLGPQPMRDGWPAALTAPFKAIELASEGARLSLAFQGELFELEDQRNWGDASYKIYCTPLALGFPRAVKAGQRIAHRVAAQFEVDGSPHEPRVGVQEPCPFPFIGAESSALGAGSAAERISWAHVACRLHDAAVQATSAPLELRLQASELQDEESLKRQLRPLHGRVARRHARMAAARSDPDGDGSVRRRGDPGHGRSTRERRGFEVPHREVDRDQEVVSFRRSQAQYSFHRPEPPRDGFATSC